jgi:transposase
VEIISRDRSKDHQRGATDGAPPGPSRVLDRWHLLKNRSFAIERFLSHSQMPTETSEDDGLAASSRQKRTSGEQVRSQGSRARRLALYQQVNALYQQGGTILGIARHLHLGHRRGRNFVRSPNFPAWGKPARTRSAIDPLFGMASKDGTGYSQRCVAGPGIKTLFPCSSCISQRLDMHFTRVICPVRNKSALNCLGPG